MKGNTYLRTVEPLAAIRKYPMAATIGGLCTAIICGLMGTLAEGGLVGMAMAAIGAVVGAPGAAHIADDAAERRRPV